MAPTVPLLYVHRNRWDGERNDLTDPDFAIWSAHRPLRGDTAWEGSNIGWGCHFAAAARDDVRFDYFQEANRKDDAREVRLIDNQISIVLAGLRCSAAGRQEYGLEAYVRAYADEGGAREGAKLFVHTYELPWDDEDTSADALLATLAEA
jgi:hypothetical protein